MFIFCLLPLFVTQTHTYYGTLGEVFQHARILSACICRLPFLTFPPILLCFLTIDLKHLEDRMNTLFLGVFMPKHV